MNHEVVMLYSGDSPHPAHQGFVDAIGADSINCNANSPNPLFGTPFGEFCSGLKTPDYDIYIAEGSRALYAGLGAKTANQSSLVFLCGDHRLQEISNGGLPGDSNSSFLSSRIRSTGLGYFSRQIMDGVIAVSHSSAESMRSLVGTKVPVMTAKPYIQPEVFRSLCSLPIDVNSNQVAVVGSASQGSIGRYKGIDLLVEAWPHVRDHYGKLQLNIVGRGHDIQHENTEGVHVQGYVENLSDIFGPIGLYVQPSRLEVFGVTVVEAMAAGVPPLVTSTTGAKSEVNAIDSSLVKEPTPCDISEGIIQYYNRPLEERRTLAERSRKHVSDFDSTSRKAKFKNTFNNLVDAL